MKEWIDKDNSYPHAEYGESKSVLTVDSLGEMRVLYFDGGNWCWPTGEVLETAKMFPITHWMPLPEAPEDETPTGPYDLLYEEGGAGTT